jgi:hypothetical protein
MEYRRLFGKALTLTYWKQSRRGVTEIDTETASLVSPSVDAYQYSLFTDLELMGGWDRKLLLFVFYGFVFLRFVIL